jgi:hypothetical protein
MPQPFSDKKQTAAEKSNNHVFHRRPRYGIEKVARKKDRRPYLVHSPNQNGKIENPKGAVADSPRFCAFFTIAFGPVSHWSPQRFSFPDLHSGYWMRRQPLPTKLFHRIAVLDFFKGIPIGTSVENLE